MKLLIIGHSVLDYVECDKKIKIQPGGIFYTTAGFASLMNKSDEFYLVTSIDGKNDNYFFPTFSNFDLSYSEKTDSIPKVHLKIWEHKEREEKFENFTKELKLTSITDYNQFDGILINMISGNDISIDKLEQIRRDYSGKIYLDIHALSKGSESDGSRIFRKIQNMKKWLACTDILQVNELELNSISEGETQLDKAKFILENGTTILLVTKGDVGVRAYFNSDEEIASIFLPAEKVNSVNKVGCGDIFGAYFFYTYIDNQNLTVALKSANKAAAIVTTYNSTKNIINLKNDFLK